MTIIFYLNDNSAPYTAERLHFEQDMPIPIDLPMGAQGWRPVDQFDCTLELDPGVAVGIGYYSLMGCPRIRICSDHKRYIGTVKKVEGGAPTRLRIMFDKYGIVIT